MTFTDELPQEERLEEEGGNYPEAFGITFTPLVSGIIFGVAGAIAAVYLWFNLVQPSRQEYNELVTQKNDLERQLEQQPDLQNRVNELNQEIQEVRFQQREVLALLSNPKSLDTLLFDLEQTIPQTSQQIETVETEEEAKEFQLTSIEPQMGQPEVINDGSFGEALNGKIQHKTYNLEVIGTYAQTQQFLRKLEQLQPLLLINNFNTEVSEEQQGIFSFAENRFIITSKPQLQSSFQLEAILPVDLEVLREMEQKTEEEEASDEEE